MFSAKFFHILSLINNPNTPLSSYRLNWLNSNFKMPNINSFLKLYYTLGDQDSKNLLLKIVMHSIEHAVSGENENFKFIDSSIWAQYQQASQKIEGVPDSYLLDKIETFILEGYNYKDICCVAPGDTVLDCGAYTGNTALYFSRMAAETGRVYSFEAMPQTYDKLARNIQDLCLTNVECFNNALNDTCETLFFSEEVGPGARVSAKPTKIQVQAVSIDSFVEKHSLQSVDFIKMDIEGNELAALKGATRTIQSFLPKLAICIYHKDSDFYEIPDFIRSLSTSYKFYLKHNSPDFGETVLFAIQDKEVIPSPDVTDEALLVSQWWSLISSLIKNRQKKERMYLLDLYVTSLSNYLGCDLNFIKDDQNAIYSYFPLSNDLRLHYEFLFAGADLQVALHFEGQWEKYSDLIPEIITRSNINTRMIITSGITGCAYIPQNQHDHKFVAHLMFYLMKISLPVLRTHHLISDKFYFEYLERLPFSG